MNIYPAHSSRIGTTTGARAILVTVGGVLGDGNTAADRHEDGPGAGCGADPGAACGVDGHGGLLTWTVSSFLTTQCAHRLRGP